MIKCQVLQWQEARKEILPLNKKLCEIIDSIGPESHHTLYKIKYRFGDEILRKASFYLPTETNQLLPLDNPQISQKIKNDLGYNFKANPVGLLIKNSVELFINPDSQIIPYAIFSLGEVFGTYRILDAEVSHCPSTFLWGMTAGARSIFMLPKISEAVSHNYLNKKFQLKLEKPNCLVDQWEVFRQLAGHPELGEPWEVEFLFFSKAWFDNIHDPAWEKLKLYLVTSAFQKSSYQRNEYVWNFVFSLTQKNRGLKVPAYISNITKHLLSLSVDAFPGFRPALNDSLAPIQKLQSIYIQHYGLKSHLPIIMQPDYFSNKKSPIYYSLQYPTTMEFIPKTSMRNSILTDEYHVHSLLKKIMEEIKSEKLNISDIPLRKIPEEVNFDFFHNNVESYKDIKESKDIHLEDSAFISAYRYIEDRTFPKNSSFLNGCVRISQKE